MSALFEFIHFQTVTATIIAIFVLLLFNGSITKVKKKFTISNAMKVLLVLVFLIPFVESYSLSRDAQFNMPAMKENKTLICENADTNKYQVSQVNGWKVEKNYFLKDSLMIRADRCEVQD